MSWSATSEDYALNKQTRSVIPLRRDSKVAYGNRPDFFGMIYNAL